jgi:ketosteroid isomerase-like protein
VDKDKQPGKASISTSADRAPTTRARSDVAPSSNPVNVPAKREDDELYSLLPELRPPKLSAEAIAAAMQAMQIEPEIMDADAGKSPGSEHSLGQSAGQHECAACGHQNRRGNKFCNMCGAPMDGRPPVARNVDWQTGKPPLSADVLASSAVVEPTESPNGAHHYHHHYHHHYFQGAPENAPARASASARDPEKLRGSPVLKGDSMSRGEAAVRRVTQEWVLACNTKHLDDLLDLYSADALVLRSNYPSVRGSAAIREFFFNALDSGLGEVEIEPLRVEVVGGIAYEAGRCKALVSGGLAGKRREERGKYLWVLTKQDDGDWKVTADCWSSDLTLPTAESEISLVPGGKPGAPRKNL